MMMMTKFQLHRDRPWLFHQLLKRSHRLLFELPMHVLDVNEHVEDKDELGLK